MKNNDVLNQSLYWELEQIKELLSIDVFSHKKIRIMPDVHAGAGCVIGFTGDLGDKVISNIVGVDIGCGMRILMKCPFIYVCLSSQKRAEREESRIRNGEMLVKQYWQNFETK